MAVWIDVDSWLRRREGDAPPARPAQVAPEQPTSDRFAELLERLDQVAAAHKPSRRDRRGGHYCGRRVALIASQELARGVYQLCLAEGVAPIRGALGAVAPVAPGRLAGARLDSAGAGSPSRAGPGPAGWPHEPADPCPPCDRQLRARRREAQPAQPAADGADSTRVGPPHRPGRRRSRGWSAYRTTPRPACCPSRARSATATQRRSWATGRVPPSRRSRRRPTSPATATHQHPWSVGHARP
jgi:hypothetical protein